MSSPSWLDQNQKYSLPLQSQYRLINSSVPVNQHLYPYIPFTTPDDIKHCGSCAICCDDTNLTLNKASVADDVFIYHICRSCDRTLSPQHFFSNT